MNLKDFAKLSGVVVRRCSNEGGGTWAYTENGHPNSSICGYRTEQALYKGWAVDTFGKLPAKALFKLLAATEGEAK